MLHRPRQPLLGAPRVLALLFAAFLSLFARDVIGAGYDPWETVVAYVVHLVPVWYLLAAIVVAWRWPLVGGVAFLVFATWYLAAAWHLHWSVHLVITAPATVIGVLFVLGWWNARARGS